MELKEVKVAILSKEDKTLIKEVEDACQEAEHAGNKATAFRKLLWRQLHTEHGLDGDITLHFVKAGAIYKRILET